MSHFLPASAYMDDVIEGFANARKIAPFEDAIRDAPNWSARLTAIRAYYREYEAVYGTDYTGCDPYKGGLFIHMTPIEHLLWQDVRGSWQAPVVMQYPVGPYFVDFGCPHQRIAIEADGKEFHDPDIDRVRDQALWSEYGWKVYRVTGKQCHRTFASPAEFIADYRERWEAEPGQDEIDRMAHGFYVRSSTGVVRAIKCLELKEIGPGDYGRWMRESLGSHKLADFWVGHR